MCEWHLEQVYRDYSRQYVQSFKASKSITGLHDISENTVISYQSIIEW